MPIINLFDRVKQKSTTAGSGNITFTSSVAAFVDFSGVYTDGDELYYAIENLTDFEVGIGTYSGNALSRDTVLKSSNSDNLLNLPGDANTFVYNTYAASGAVYTSGDRLVTNVDGIDFNPIANGSQPSYQEGRVFYDLDNHALAVYNDESEITLQVGQEEYLRVRNNTTGTIFNGEAVRIEGSQGTHVTVEKAIATGDFVAQAIGLATHDIEQNSFGYVTTYGVVNDVNTNDFEDGDEVFLSPEVSGGLTGVAPTAPNYKLSLGHVVRKHPTVGQIVIKPSTPKLGGGDVKSLGNFQQSGIAFIDLVAGSDAAIISSNTGLSYDSGNQILQVDAGGVRFPDGATQTIAYTGQDADGLSSAVTVQLSNQATGSATFQNGGDTADISTFLTAAAISGQGSTSSIADADKILIERGAALRQVRKDILVTGLATESYVNTVSGNLQTQITSNDGDISTLQTATGNLDTRVTQNTSDITTVSGIAQGAADDVATASGYLQGQIDTNDADISALQTATGNLDTRVTQNTSDITTVSGLLYNNWNVNVTGNVDSITSNETVVFTGLGLTTVTYDSATNTVSISGAGDGSGESSTPTGIESGVAFFSTANNELTGVSNFVYNQVLNQVGINADPQAGLHVKNDTSAYPVLTVEAGAGQALPLTRWIDENGVVVATVDYESGTFANSGGFTFPDGVTQTIAYTGQTSEPTGTASGVAFFGDDNNLTTDSSFAWNSGSNILYIGADLYFGSTTQNRLAQRSNRIETIVNNQGKFTVFGNSPYATSVRTDGGYGWSVSTDVGTTQDTTIMKDAPQTVAIRFDDNPNEFRIYHSGDTSNYERLSIKATGYNYEISPQVNGGTAGSVIITNDTSSQEILVVKGAASQTANLQEWQDSAGTVLADVDNSGNISGNSVISQNHVGTTLNTHSSRFNAEGREFKLQWSEDSGSSYNDVIHFNGAASPKFLKLNPDDRSDLDVFIYTAQDEPALQFDADADEAIFKVPVTVSGDVDITGALTATTKSFLIDHPTKEGMKLQYASLEGPENGVYVRGTTDQSTIQLPDYWVGLVDENSITVTLTPVGSFQQLYVEEKSNTHITVGGVWGSYDYVVYGERKDVDKLEVEW